MVHVLCVGVGHVGLPLSLQLWRAGHHVAPIDVDASKIAALRAGSMPFREEGCSEILSEAAGTARFTPLLYSDATFASTVAEADYIVMTLGTPLGTDYTFRFDQYFDVLERVMPHLQRGVTLVVRSTVAPHFTRNVVSTRIAAQRHWTPGIDFFPSFCPERLLQGSALHDIEALPEIVGADDPGTAERASQLFRSLAPDKQCIVVSTVEAELAKLCLNTFRYTMFGLANEFALIAEQYGADMFRVLEAANTGYPRGGIPRPGPSRGPCLGKDTATLAFSTTAGLIAHAAIKTNENVVLHIAQELRAALGPLVGKRIAVLGLAFKADSDDTRDNLSSPLVNLLDREGAITAVYDPLVPAKDDPSVLRGSDAVVLMTAHQALAELDETALMELCGRSRRDLFAFDLWNVWPWADRIFGKGSEIDENPGYRGMWLAYAGGRAAPD